MAKSMKKLITAKAMNIPGHASPMKMTRTASHDHYRTQGSPGMRKDIGGDIVQRLIMENEQLRKALEMKNISSSKSGQNLPPSASDPSTIDANGNKIGTVNVNTYNVNIFPD
jgi:hypothetical protein